MPSTENPLGIQLPRYSKVMDPGTETAISTFLNQDNPQQHSKHLSLCTQISVIITSYQRNFSLQQMEITAEAHN